MICRREHLVQRVGGMRANQTITFPSIKNYASVHIHRILHAGEMVWKVETSSRPEPYISRNVERVVDYLLQLRSIEEFVYPLNHYRDEVDFANEYFA